jgi:hypothetical protein
MARQESDGTIKTLKEKVKRYKAAEKAKKDSEASHVVRLEEQLALKEHAVEQ